MYGWVWSYRTLKQSGARLLTLVVQAGPGLVSRRYVAGWSGLGWHSVQPHVLVLSRDWLIELVEGPLLS
jgi:hypothetical protein